MLKKKDNFLIITSKVILIKMSDLHETIIEVVLKGKEKKNNVIISLDDLESIINGINSLTKHIATEVIAKDERYSNRKYFSKELKELFSMGLVEINESQSTVLDFSGFKSERQDTLIDSTKPEHITNQVADYIKNIDISENKLHLDEALLLSSILSPLTNDNEYIQLSAYQGKKKLFTPKKLTFKDKQQLQSLINNRKLIYGEEIYGILKEINIKDYSLKLQLFNNSMEKIYFEPKDWETVRDMLSSKVKISITQSQKTKTMLTIERIGSFQEKKPMSSNDILKSGLVGILKNEDGMKNSVEFAKKLAEEVF